MLENRINFLKKKMTKEKFGLLINAFNEDVEFHKPYRENTEEELCEVLGQTYSIIMRLN